MPPSKSSDSGDEKILSYGDVVVRRSDLSILRGPHYLNDRLIDLAFAHLSSSLAAATDRLLLVPPSIAFWIAHAPDFASLHDAVAPLGLRDKDLVLLPVNDNPDVTLAEGGSHWSLLLCRPAAGEFVHHDSSGRLNHDDARRLFDAIKSFVGDAAWFAEGPTPQQTNGYDCGFFVVAIARAACDWYCGGGWGEGWDAWFDALREKVDAHAAGELREELLRLILGLMESK